MRRVIIITFFVIVILFNACGSEKVQDVRQIVYNKLHQEKKEQIKTSWDDGMLYVRDVGPDTKKVIGTESAKFYEGKQIYIIAFRISDEGKSPDFMYVVSSKDGKYRILGYEGKIITG